MLDEFEWENFHPFLADGLRTIKETRKETGLALHETNIPACYKRAIDEFERPTGPCLSGGQLMSCYCGRTSRPSRRSSLTVKMR